MAIRQISITDSLETFRTQFNDLAAQDFGDLANLSGGITATNLVDAMNETISIATSTAGFTIEDNSSTQQIIGGGDILRVRGTSNEIEAVVSATDTLTIGLPNAVSVTTSVQAPTIFAGSGSSTLSLSIGSITDSTGQISFGDENLTTTGNITATGSTQTLGTVQISGSTLSSTDSTSININDGLTVTGTISGDISSTSITSTTGSINFGDDNLLTTGYLYIGLNSPGIIFEGSSSNAFETTVRAADPTQDQLILFPNEAGTIITTGSTDAVTETMMADDAIGSAQMKNLSTLILYNSAGTPVKTIHGAGA